MTKSHPDLEAQIALEQDAVLKGYQRFMDRLETQKAQGEAGETKVGQEVQFLLVGEVTGHIRALVASMKSRPSGAHKWLPLVEAIRPEALAVEALSIGWSDACVNQPLQNTLMALGDRAELHAEVQALTEVHGDRKTRLALKTVAQTKARTQARRKAVASKAGKVGHEPWDNTTKIRVGGLLWNALCLTGLFETWTLGHAQTMKFVGLTPRGEQLALEAQHSLAWSRPLLLPTIIQPKPWTGMHSGAYYTKELQKRVVFVRTRAKAHRKALEAAVKDGSLKPVMQIVSDIQGTGFALEPQVLDLVKWSWRKGLSLKKFPSREKVKATLPWDLEYMDIREKSRHLAIYYKAQRYNRGITSNAAAMRRDLETADWLVGLDAFYLPHSLDFRGRVYPIPSFNHQRSDYVKAMFRFAQGKRLGAEGIRALKWHIANTGDFGKVSKKSWDDRVAWTEENMDLVLRVAKDPRRNLEWTRADKPFSFYHACLELSRALELENPEDFVSALPVDLDGSNSGVQHYSAALRGEEGALVNLTPSDRPADVYAVVAQKVKAHAETVAAPHVDPAAYKEALWALEKAKADKGDLDAAKAVLEPLAARLWLDFGITRSEVKRPTMTRGYGSETFGFRNQIIEDLMEPLAIEVMTGKRPVHPFGSDEGKYAASWMAGRIWDALSQVLVKTSEGMEYLQKVASVLAKDNLGVSWSTTLGFPVVQRYEEAETSTVDLWLYGREAEVPTEIDADSNSKHVLRRYQIRIFKGGKDTLVKHRQANAVAPNFIHSQDATHLLMSVQYAVREEIRDFLLVHDSFGTHAANIERFGQCCRRAFVDLYETHDCFQAFHRAAEAALGDKAASLPDIPEKGSLDLQGVLKAAYTFS